MKQHGVRGALSAAAIVGAVLSGGPPVRAQAPAEVTGVHFPSPVELAWAEAVGADDYVVHAGPLSKARGGVFVECDGGIVAASPYLATETAQPGHGVHYLVLARGPGGGGTPGAGSDGLERRLDATCDSVLAQHVADRAGFGGDEWTRTRIDALGLEGFIDEQLDPSSIDESSNSELATRRAEYEPPETLTELQALGVVNAVYAKRQLEQRATLFWTNHFNTDYREVNQFFSRYSADPIRRRQEATRLLHDELESFRATAFSGSFRQILEKSALSPAMILFLDTNNNVDTAPNENYARELLELHTMGVDGGFTHHDIEALARVMTGWNVCKKPPEDAADYNTGCIANSLIGTVDEPDGAWIANFRRARHDCGQKVLFSGTPQETVIPDSCGNLRDGVQDLFLALDAIANHPSTARFVSTKLLKSYVTDAPTESMVDAVVAAWNDPTSPAGRGDLREVLRAVLAPAHLLDPARSRSKVKTPFEHVTSALRAVRGNTNGRARVAGYLRRMGHELHENPIPTGYPERADAWIETNGILERFNFGLDMAGRTGNNFGTDLVGLLTDNGISTAPGNATAIVDFFAGVLFGHALDASARQAAIDYLETDDAGVPSPYTTARIRETVGFMLGFPEFTEQ